MAAFGSFTFAFTEEPIWNTDTRWRRRPSYSRRRPLGGGTDVIRTMALGSYTRSFDVMLSDARYSALLALLNTLGTFTDWDSPTPNARAAFLSDVVMDSMIDNTDLTADMFHRVHVELVSQ